MTARPFIILTSQRSGSVYLQKYLHSHPDVRCHGEILLGLGGPCEVRPPAFLNRYRRMRLTYAWVFSGAALRPNHVIDRTWADGQDAETDGQDAGAVGFRVMYNQLNRDSVVRHLCDRDDLRVVHLIRRNFVRQYVSRKQMHDRYRSLGTGSAHTDKPVRPTPVAIPPRRAVAEINALRESRRRLETNFADAGRPLMKLVYEDLLSAGTVGASDRREVCSFLGVDDAEMSSNLVKMNPAPLSELVSNYDAFADAIRSAGWGEHLGESDDDASAATTGLLRGASATDPGTAGAVS